MPPLAIRLITLMAGTAAFVGTVIIANAQPDQWFLLGREYQTARGQGGAVVVARVNGEAIAQGDIVIGQALARFNNAVSPNKVGEDAKSVLTVLVRERAMAAEAKARGLEPTPVQTAEYVAQIRAAFHENRRAAGELARFLTGLGETEEAFFQSTFAQRRYGDALAIARLREKVIGGVAAGQHSSAWSQFEERVARAARVQIVDPNLR